MRFTLFAILRLPDDCHCEEIRMQSCVKTNGILASLHSVHRLLAGPRVPSTWRLQSTPRCQITITNAVMKIKVNVIRPLLSHYYCWLGAWHNVCCCMRARLSVEMPKLLTEQTYIHINLNGRTGNTIRSGVDGAYGPNEWASQSVLPKHG